MVEVKAGPCFKSQYALMHRRDGAHWHPRTLSDHARINMKPSRMSVGFIGFAAAVFFCGTVVAIELDLENCTLQVGNETP